MKIRNYAGILCGALLLLNPLGLQAAISVTTANTETAVTGNNFTYGANPLTQTSTSVSPTAPGGSYNVNIPGSPSYTGAASCASGSNIGSFSLQITNNTGIAIDSIVISATMIQFKENSGSAIEVLTAAITGITPTTIAGTGAQNNAASGTGALSVKSINTASQVQFTTGTYGVTMSGFTLAAGASFTITWSDANDGGTDGMFGLANMKVTLGTSAPANNDTAIVANNTNVAMGRVMQGTANPTNNVTLDKTGGNSTTYNTSASGDATVADNGTNFAAGSQSDQISVGVDRSTTGVKSGTVTVDNQATTSNAAGQGSDDANEVINVSATVVADRQINGTANVGDVFVGTAVTGTATLTTTGDNDHFTAVTVSGSAVTQGDVSVAAGTTTTFNDASDTTTREITTTFTQSGGASKNVDLIVSGEGLAGEQDKATATIQANVWQHAELTTNTSETLTDGSTATVFNNFNSDGGQRAAAVVTSATTNGAGWSATALAGGATEGSVAEGEEITSTVSFDSTNKLNGTHIGSLVVGFADQAGIKGGGSLGSQTWELSAEVSGNTAASGVAQLATVLAGKSFAGLNTTHNGGLATQVAIRAGTATAKRDLSMTFSNIIPGNKEGVDNDATRVSDIVNLEGTGNDVIVVEMSYLDNGISDESTVGLGWLAGDEWVLATDGNTGAGILAGAHAMSYDAFLAANGGVFDAATMLGAYGVDTEGNTTWAVINHNSEFAANSNLAAIPEPGTMVLAALGGLAFCFRRRSRR